jgi:hypothetical protein
MPGKASSRSDEGGRQPLGPGELEGSGPAPLERD